MVFIIYLKIFMKPIIIAIVFILANNFSYADMDIDLLRN